MGVAYCLDYENDIYDSSGWYLVSYSNFYWVALHHYSCQSVCFKYMESGRLMF